MAPAPIVVCTDGNVSCGTLLWRYRGRLQLTVVVKALFTIVPDGVATSAGPGELIAEDRTFEGNPSRSVEVASDLVPYRTRCDVTFVGHAYAPQGRPAPTGSVRLGLAREGRLLLDKVLHVFGDRGASGAPEAFDRMPLVYERARGGAGEPNPIGSETPNVLDPADARRPGGYGPISRFWAARKRLLGKIDKRALEAPIASIPDEMPWDYFQAAPAEQQIEPLRGGEWLVLDGVHVALPRMQTRLPAARGAARVVVRQPGAAPLEHPVELLCDTLAIDGDRRVLAMVWRGRHEVVGGEAALVSLAVAAALETPGAPVDWARVLAVAPSAVAAVAPTLAAGAASSAGEGTVVPGPDVAAFLARRPVVPFAGAAASRPAGPLSASATPWGGQPGQPASQAAPGEGTVAMTHEAPGESTYALRGDEHAVLARQPIAPFPIPSAGAPSSGRAAAPGLPWTAPMPASAPIPMPGPGEETVVPGAAPPSVPIASFPIASFPIASAPIASAPIASAPITSEPVAMAAAPAHPLAERLRMTGASADDVAALLAALDPPSSNTR